MTDSSGNKKCNVLVTGDVCHDVYIATTHDPQYHNLWRTDNEWASISRGPGSAALLYELLDEIQQASGKFNLFSYLPDRKNQENWTQLFNLIKPFGNKPKKDNEFIWRIAGFLGQQIGEINKFCLQNNDCELVSPKDIPQFDIVVIDEKNQGFRDNEKEHKNLEQHIKQANYVIYRMARPLCQGKLWDKISTTDYANRLIVVFTISDLRYADVKVGQCLSWEQLVEDIFYELKKETSLSHLMNCAHIIISFDDAGALLRTNNSSTLFFRPTTLEGQRNADIEGRVTGYAYCLLAAITNALASSTDKNINIMKKAIENGIQAEVKLYNDGFEAIKAGTQTKKKVPWSKIVFPYKVITDNLIKTENEKDDADKNTETVIKEINIDDSVPPEWSIINQVYKSNHEALNEVIRNILTQGVAHGIKTTPLPYWKVSDKLMLVDRSEIESLRGIEALVREYIAGKDNKERPLSFAIFGPPGSGKSFTVKELAAENHWKAENLTFNLSQFSRPEDLCGAFHQVRSVGLKGKLPLVFWDEFDTNQLFWLRFFLAPMQDGQFIDGQLTHSIGRAIFVFAGGTFDNFETFHGKVKTKKAIKGPDFISRLSGFVNIRGVNMPESTARKDRTSGLKKPNIECQIRRAILLRSLLERYAEKVFHPGGGSHAEFEEGKQEPPIDLGLLEAFLNIQKFTHGARSLDAIISGSHLSDQRKYTRSALPPRSTMSLHLDVDEFYDLMKTSK